MELVKNIFFNTDKIVENSKLKISYVGSLYQNQSEEVFLHYGFGQNWDNTKDIKMERTELGFQCEIDILESDVLNLCFRNGKNEWDNNNNENYIFPVEKYSEEDVQELGLISLGENQMQMHKGLRKSYIWSKKVRIAVYKLLRYIPKIISGNYKRKITE